MKVSISNGKYVRSSKPLQGVTYYAGLAYHDSEFTENHLMSFMINNLAVKFCDVLHEWLTEEELAIVVDRNSTRECEYVCHSHDFCDANMAMDEAWSRMFQDDCDLSSDADVELWNSAWNLAKKHNFNTNK